MARTVGITQRLVKLQEEKALKEHVHTEHCKEEILKAKLGPRLDESYVLITNIQGKLASLWETKKKIQMDNTRPVTK